MALRDHTLDDKITAAALKEFSEKGFAGASLRKIAEKAGATVGAIQTRYKSKDELFLCLLEPLLRDVEATFQNVKSDYYGGGDGEFLTELKNSMRRESEMILHLIFAHYEEAVLLFYRSAGSRAEHYFEQIVERKCEESMAFFHHAGYENVDETLFRMLLSAQFDSYRRIVALCADKETAEKYMQAMMVYHFGGWSALFDAASGMGSEAK